MTEIRLKSNKKRTGGLRWRRMGVDQRLRRLREDQRRDVRWRRDVEGRHRRVAAVADGRPPQAQVARARCAQGAPIVQCPLPDAMLINGDQSGPVLKSQPPDSQPWLVGGPFTANQLPYFRSNLSQGSVLRHATEYGLRNKKCNILARLSVLTHFSWFYRAFHVSESCNFSLFFHFHSPLFILYLFPTSWDTITGSAKSGTTANIVQWTFLM